MATSWWRLFSHTLRLPGNLLKSICLLPLILLALTGCKQIDPRESPTCSALIWAFIPPDAILEKQAAERTGERIISQSFRYHSAADTGDWQEDRISCHFAPVAEMEDLHLAAVVLASQGWLDDRRLDLLRLWARMQAPTPDRMSAISADLPSPPGLNGAAFALQIILNGLVLGAVYALIAAGYGIIFSLLETVNFAFGDMTMLATIFTVIPFAVAVTLGIDAPLLLVPLVLLLVPLLSGLVGLVSERLVYRRLEYGNRLTPLVAAIGLSLVLQNSVFLAQGARPKWLAPVIEGSLVLPLPGGNIHFSVAQLAVLLAAGFVTLLLWRLLVGTSFGRALRATAADRQAAALCGVQVHRVNAQAFFLSGALAGFGGVIFMLHYGQTDHSVGLWIGFKALTGAIIGGLGSPLGALAGGLLAGLGEGLFAGFISNTWRDLALFSLLVIVLLIRPTGLFGDRGDTNH